LRERKTGKTSVDLQLATTAAPKLLRANVAIRLQLDTTAPRVAVDRRRCHKRANIAMREELTGAGVAKRCQLGEQTPHCVVIRRAIVDVGVAFWCVCVSHVFRYNRNNDIVCA
jgi:hypothetical protein